VGLIVCVLGNVAMVVKVLVVTVVLGVLCIVYLFLVRLIQFASLYIVVVSMCLVWLLQACVGVVSVWCVMLGLGMDVWLCLMSWVDLFVSSHVLVCILWCLSCFRWGTGRAGALLVFWVCTKKRM
jgi:hypothetical protein